MSRELFGKIGFVYSPEFDEYYENAVRKYQAYGDKIFRVEDDSIFGIYRDEINACAVELAKDSDNSVYAYLLAELISKGKDNMVYALSKPYAEKKTAICDTLPLFSLIWCLPEMIDEHKRRGVPEAVTRDTIGMFENQIGDFVVLNGHVGISSYVNWMMSFIKCRIIRVGRFNLEMCEFNNKYVVIKNTDDAVVLSDGEVYHSSGRVLGSIGCENSLDSFKCEFVEEKEYFEGYVCDGEYCGREPQRFYKSDGWDVALRWGDPIVSVHIPTGSPLNAETCNNDFMYGADIIKRCFGDFKAFYCSSWLLDPQLKRLLGKETSLTAFADRFLRFPVKSSGNEVFEYVFNLHNAVPPSELNVTTSLSKALKEHFILGRHVYGAAGIFFEKV